MSVLAIVPARSGSKGIPGKNFRILGDRSLVEHAICRAWEGGGDTVQVCLSTDDDEAIYRAKVANYPQSWHVSMIHVRPPQLAQDDTPMIDVVKHALEQVPGPDDQIIILLQPTQPFRTAAHVQQAIALLQETQADSVVTVVELPATYHPETVLEVSGGQLFPWLISHDNQIAEGDAPSWWRANYRMGQLPACRQGLAPVYIRDGTCYAFTRRTVSRYRDIYGKKCVPLIIPPGETCELDTLEDWAEVERRWHAQR